MALCLPDSTPGGRADLRSLTVEEWLRSLRLERYVSHFVDNLFTSMERVVDVWDDELTSILEIDKLGHRCDHRNLKSKVNKTGATIKI
jgi:hypothetical protein